MTYIPSLAAFNRYNKYKSKTNTENFHSYGLANKNYNLLGNPQD